MLKHIIDRPIGVSMALLVVVVLGIVSLHFIPVSLIPEVDIPSITVQATEASFSAREMDERVVTPLRNQLIQVNGLQDIVCEARDGNATIRLTFNHGAKMDYLFIEVNEKIDRAMGSLPRMDRPKVVKASASDIPVFFINISQPSNSNITALSRLAREVLAKRIEQLPEVAMVDISGLVNEEILIIPDETRISHSGLTTTQIEQAIKASDISLGSLTIRDEQYQYGVKFDARSSSPQDIANIWFHCGDRLLQVKDVAHVECVPAKRTGMVRSNGTQAICMAVIKQSDARIGAMKKAMSELLEHFKNDYPELTFQVTRDQTELLEYSIQSLIWNIILGIVLSCLVIFLFMQDFRSPALVSLTIPTALILSMLLFYVIGISLNIISLSGLLLGVGMMADNTIILIDNITERWKRGDTLRDAVLTGTREVTGPMLSSVLTTCAVFIPLIFVSGIAGELFYDEAMAVTIVLFSSFIVTITVIPVFYWCWYKGMSSFSPSRLLLSINPEGVLQKWDDRRTIWWMGHSKIAWAVIGLSAIGAGLCFTYMHKERLPEMTQTDALLQLEWNDRISAEENEQRIIELESFISRNAYDVTSLVGTQQFLLNHSEEQGINEAQIYFRCEDSKTFKSLQARLDTLLDNNPNLASWAIQPAGNLFDVTFGDDRAMLTARLRPIRENVIHMDQLRSAMKDIRTAIPEEHIPAIITRMDVLFTADAEKMALYDISYGELSTLLKQSLNENHLFSVVSGPQSLPVITGTDKKNLTEILTGVFIEKNGVRIPIMEVMRQSYAEDLKTLISGPEGCYYPVDLQPVKANADDIIMKVRQAIRSNDAYDVSFSGSLFSTRKMVRELLVILLVSILLLYLILAIQFESLVQPLIILSELVVDIFIAIAAIWIIGLSINLMSLIGLVVVCGIVINDSILKIDTINKLRAEGVKLRDAVITASRRRMKAIIMTSLTTILAIIPFLSRGSMGADLQYPMCLVIIVGMISGTLVSLFLVPALYCSIYAREPDA